MTDALLGLALAAASLAFSLLAVAHARPAVVNFGPNDLDYASGFREGWERDRLTRFHWTTRHSEVRLPLLVSGDGIHVAMRIRRHLVEPANVIVRSEGRVVMAFTIQADPRVAYRTIAADLPTLEGRLPLTFTIDSASADARPLGIAIDWMQVERARSSARFRLLPGTQLAVALVALVAFAAPRLAGASRRAASLHAAAVAVAIAAGGWTDVLAIERILREGGAVYAVVALAAAGLVRSRYARATFEIDEARTAGGLVLVVMAALALRLAVLLHPQFYYPDVRVHSLFVWQLARRGLVAFLQHFTENQYRYSLGLQMEHGHWYAFPYPPAFYVLCWPLVRLARMRPEVAASVLPAAVNSLEGVIVFGIARRLRAPRLTALGAAAVLSVLPLFLARLSLAYFPAIVGHAVDAAVVLYLIRHLDEASRPRVVLTLAALVALALLTYTQSLLNFAVLIPLLLVLMLLRDRSRAAWPRIAAIAVAATVGAVLSLALFYGRYVPVFVDMQRGIPMAEERVLTEKPSTPLPPEELVPEEPDDPFAGPTVDLWRGVRKAGWRLYVFYGPFAAAVLVGLALVWRDQAGNDRALVLAWTLTYLALNLLSGGLPGPNLVRYNKDLEVVAPLFCLALARVGTWLWARARWAAVLYAAAFGAFGVMRAATYLAERIVFER